MGQYNPAPIIYTDSIPCRSCKGGTPPIVDVYWTRARWVAGGDMRLTSSDYASLMRQLPRLYELLDAPQFMRRALQVISSIVPADNVAWIGFTAHPAATLTSWQPLVPCGSDEILARMGQGMASHPFLAAGDRLRTSSAVLLLTDAPRRLVERHRREYADVYERLDFRYAMFAIVGVDEGDATGITLSRRLVDFTDRHRALLAALVPHLQRSLANARLVSAYRSGTAAPVASAKPFHDLTPREQEIAFWLARGKSNVEIGLIVGAGTRTVEKHVEAILRKLGSANRTSAAVALAPYWPTSPVPASDHDPAPATRPGLFRPT